MSGEKCLTTNQNAFSLKSRLRLVIKLLTVTPDNFNQKGESIEPFRSGRKRIYHFSRGKIIKILNTTESNFRVGNTNDC